MHAWRALFGAAAGIRTHLPGTGQAAAVRGSTAGFEGGLAGGFPEAELLPRRVRLRPLITARQLLSTPLQKPAEIIGGMLHQGCKMVLAGTSKSNKSWCLLDLALSVASGTPWWRLPTPRAEVVYVNFELTQWAVQERIELILQARPECEAGLGGLTLLNLRGESDDLTKLRPELEEALGQTAGLVILHPAYKLLGSRDENSNGEITSLMNEFDQLTKATEAAVVFAHHYAKGNSAAKDPKDRMCGAGTWTRDPDAILELTPHEEPGCFTVTSILRNHPELPEFVVRWDHPLMQRVDLNPGALDRPQRKNKTMTDDQFLRAFITHEPCQRKQIVCKGKRHGLSSATVHRFLARLVRSGCIESRHGRYRSKPSPGPSDCCP